MAKAKPRAKRVLSEREAALCRRLREIRERLNYSQGDVARQLGITRERLASYEEGRAPIRFEFALRFCWQLVVSEEWLALGEDGVFERLKEWELKRGWPEPKKPGKFVWYPSMARMSMSLLYHEVYHKIKPETLFIEAYDQYLKPIFNDLAAGQMSPRVTVSENVSEDLIRNYFHALMESWLQALDTSLEKMRFLNELASQAGPITHGLHVGFLTTFERIAIIDDASKSGLLTPEIENDPDKLEEFIYRETPKFLAREYPWAKVPPQNISETGLTQDSDNRKNEGVKSQIGLLLKELRPLVAPKGMKAKLAEYLEVPQSRVSEWLTGKYEPAGEMALRIKKWVDDPKERTK